MRKYLQITLVFLTLLFLVWFRNAKLKDDVTKDIKPKILNPTLRTPTLSPTLAILKPTLLFPKSVNKSLPSITSTQIPIKITSTPIPTPTIMGLYKNGTYNGSIADAYYGNIQVQVVISGGKITDVIFLQYPNDNPTSQYINSQAMPILKQEVLQAQSANVSGISGASATSPAFQSSLADALSQAKN